MRCVESKLEAAREILGFWGRALEKGETAEIVEKARKEVERWDELVLGEVVRHRDWEERRAKVLKHQGLLKVVFSTMNWSSSGQQWDLDAPV